MSTTTATELRIAPHEGILDRLNARLRSRSLDLALARGIDPETSVPLLLRARRLTSLSRRRVIAEGLRRAVLDATRWVPPAHVRISPVLAQVAGAVGELTRLADELAAPGPVAARGVAQAWVLLTDGIGPLYNPNSTANLRVRAATATANLSLDD